MSVATLVVRVTKTRVTRSHVPVLGVVQLRMVIRVTVTSRVTVTASSLTRAKNGLLTGLRVDLSESNFRTAAVVHSSFSLNIFLVVTRFSCRRRGAKFGWVTVILILCSVAGGVTGVLSVCV